MTLLLFIASNILTATVVFTFSWLDGFKHGLKDTYVSLPPTDAFVPENARE